jgi:signal transduction histidine kinase
LKKIFALFFILLAYPYIGLSQDIQHYRSIADTTHNAQLKLVALDSVISKSRNLDNDSFIVFSIQYIKLAKKIDSIDSAAKKAMNLQYILTTKKNDPRKAITIIDEVLANKYKIKDSFLLGGLYLKRGGANFRIDFNESIKDYTKALNNFGQKDSIYKADTYLFRGQAYSSLGKFVPAGEDYNLAYIYFENLKDYEYMQYAQQGNITMYSMNGFYEKAKKERTLLIDKLTELKLGNLLVMPYYNQALDYKKQGNKKLQKKYLLKADSSLTDDNTKLDYIIIHTSLANYYSDDYEVEKAEEQFAILDNMLDIIKGDLFAETYYYGAKANYYEKNEDYEQALIYANKKMKISNILKHGEDKMDAHLLLSNIYYKTEKYKNSLDNKNRYIEIKDSIFNFSAANSLAYFQTLYETEKKEKELVEKTTDIILLEKDNKAFKQISLIVGIALALLFGIILLYRNQKELKNINTLQENFSQDLIQSQENERIRISKDLHDDLGQKLLIIKNKLINSGNEETKKLVEGTINDVRAISRDLYPFQLQELGITKAIEHTITQIDENTTLFISSEIENIDNIFKKELEVNIYRIIQESLSNIIKHAKAEASKVSITKLKNSVKITIKDNGIGYDFSEKYKATNSLGLKTLLERTKFLNGQMKVRSKKGDGTLIEFIFPFA